LRPLSKRPFLKSAAFTSSGRKRFFRISKIEIFCDFCKLQSDQICRLFTTGNFFQFAEVALILGLLLQHYKSILLR
jgi:hypothetical protein